MADVVELNSRPYEVKRGDTRPKYAVQLKDNLDKAAELQTVFDLDGDEKIMMVVRKVSEPGPPLFEGEADIEDAPTAVVSYTPKEGDYDITPDEYGAEFVIEDSEGGVESVPNKGFFKLIVNPNLRQ